MIPIVTPMKQLRRIVCSGCLLALVSLLPGIASTADYPQLQQLRELVKQTRQFETPIPSAGDAPPRSGQPKRVDLHKIIERAAAAYRLPASVIASVMKIESDFSPCAVSHAGAMGLMQLMPETAKTYQIADPFDPEQNVLGGAAHLARALKKSNNRLLVAAAIYNGGDRILNRRWYGWKVETRNYVKKLRRVYLRYKQGQWKNRVPRYVTYSCR